MDWKWGHAQCEAEVKLDRSVVAKVLAEPKLELKVGKHKVMCNLEQEDGKETHKINFTIDPTVTFENGKAVKAVLGWGEVDGTHWLIGVLVRYGCRQYVQCVAGSCNRSDQ